MSGSLHEHGVFEWFAGARIAPSIDFRNQMRLTLSLLSKRNASNFY